MTIGCKGNCGKYMSDRRTYDNGTTYCGTCRIFIDYEGNRCPCCHYPVRRRPRSKLSQINKRFNIAREASRIK